MTIELKNLELWFITGSQHLYGEETLKQVAEHSKIIAKSFDEHEKIPVSVSFKPVLTTPDAIYQLMLEANASPQCIGLICWRGNANGSVTDKPSDLSSLCEHK